MNRHESLTAAAPELYKALQIAEARLTELAEILMRGGEVLWLAELEQISAALSKAEGK